MAKRVEGKVVIVTGAAVGLGAAIAARLAEEGASVIVTDMDDVNGKACAASIAGRFIRHDVTDEAEWIDLIAGVERDHGRLDALVNNAALAMIDGPTDPEGSRLDDWRRIQSVNVEGTFLGCKHAVAAIARSGGGAVVNMSSIGGIKPSPFITAYGASKAAVTHFTRSLAQHCCAKGYAVRCNSVHPGQVRTRMHDEVIRYAASSQGITLEQAEQGLLSMIPMGRFQEPVDIANGVLFLVSDEARFVTGIALSIDGGMAL